MNEPTLRELIELRIDSLRSLVDERVRAQENALALQAREYERRLDHLNGEAERLLRMQSLSVSRELYDTDLANIKSQIADLNEFKATIIGRQTVISSTIAAGVSLLVVALSLLLK